MFDRFDQADLLAYVEGTLASPRRAAFEASLQRHPEVREALVRMRADRLRLQALPEVEAPTHLLSDLESRLARPMLMAERDPSGHRSGARAVPGTYGHRRRARARRRTLLVRSAALLFLAFIVTAGGWLLSGRTGFPPGREGPLSIDERVVADRGDEASPVMETAAPGITTAIAHALPFLLPEDKHGDHGPSAAPKIATTPVDGLRTKQAPLMLVILGDAELSSTDAVERRLMRALHGADPAELEVALTRNLSQAELDRAMRHHFADVARREQPHAAGLSPGARGSFDGRVLMDMLLKMRQTDEAEAITGGVSLTGPEMWHPSLNEQIQLAARGAVHTLTLRRSQLTTLLNRLNGRLPHERPIAILLTDEDPVPSTRSGSAAAQWLIAHERLRRTLLLLEDMGSDADDDPLIRLPVLAPQRPADRRSNPR